MRPLLTFLGCMVASAVLCGLAARWLRRLGAFDQVNARSSHAQATLRGGGLGIVGVVLAGGAWLATQAGWMPLAVILPVLLIVAGVSFRDDVKNVPASIRFACHALAAVITLAALQRAAPDGWAAGLPVWLGWMAGFLWISGHINAFNFMDGINGLAGFQAVVTAAGTALIGSIASGRWTEPPVIFAWIVAGAAAGFLPHNFPRARMFMGDVGSASLGYLLAALVLWVARDGGAWLLIPLLLLHANFVLDTGITLVRRMLRGEDFFQPHREHFYQRLIRAGRSHPFVTGWELIIQLLVLASLVGYLHFGTAGRLAMIVLVLALWGGFFVGCERALRTASKPRA